MVELAHHEAGGQPGGSRPTSLWARLGIGSRERRVRRDAAHALYMAVVAQARLPFFFRDLAVPDSRDGRLEMVQLHSMLAMRRLSPLGASGVRLSQSLYDLMFNDLDRHLREWGVGDLSVGKHVKKHVQSFMGRVAALDPALEAGDARAMEDPLRHNVYGGGTEVDAAVVTALARYLLAQHRHLAAADGGELLRGVLVFAPPEQLLAAERAAD